MMTVTLQLPEHLLLRLQQVAQATRQSLNDVFVRVVQTGSPPDWQDVPAEFQADLADLDRLDDASLWRIARAHQSEREARNYQALLEKNANDRLSEIERNLLQTWRADADRFMLRKAHAAALLRWRGHHIPPADAL